MVPHVESRRGWYARLENEVAEMLPVGLVMHKVQMSICWGRGAQATPSTCKYKIHSQYLARSFILCVLVEDKLSGKGYQGQRKGSRQIARAGSRYRINLDHARYRESY